MTFLALIGHIANLFAPAIGMAVLLWGMPRLWPKARVGRWAARRELMVLCALGTGVLLAGLVVFGRDGKIADLRGSGAEPRVSVAWWLRGR